MWFWIVIGVLAVVLVVTAVVVGNRRSVNAGGGNPGGRSLQGDPHRAKGQGQSGFTSDAQNNNW